MFKLSCTFANMIELIQHIERLLSENECVIIPNFGGFIVHYTPASYVEKDNLFLPPSRVIGFNPQLRINDGLLIQSYMAANNVGFSEAVKIIDGELRKLIVVLHKEGRITLNSIGELHYTINGNYEFMPNSNKTIPTAFYGLAPFEIEKLDSVQKKKRLMPTGSTLASQKKQRELRIEHTLLRNAVAIAAVFILFFAFSTPIQNTDISNSNYAKLLPSELFEQVEEQAVTTVRVVSCPPVVEPQLSSVETPVKEESETAAKNDEAKASAATETEQPQATAPVQANKEQLFHIIVAGGIGSKDAEKMVNELKGKGFDGATVLNSDGKIRVSIRSFENNTDAMKSLLELRKNESYQNAWLLTPKK